MATEIKGKDLLKAIEDLLSKPHEPEEDAGGVTSWQVARAMGIERGNLQEKLRILVETGVLEVRWGRRRNIMGQLRRTPIYVVIEKTLEARKAGDGE